MDIWGPLNTKSHDGFTYFLTVLDDHTRCVWTFLMRNKGETRSLIQSFCSMVSTQFSSTVKIIRSDQGLEFKMDSFFSTHGILHQTSCVSIAAQNGRVERKHQHLLAVARSLRFQSGLSLRFWGECILHACYLINRLPTPVLHNKSPYEVLYNTIPSYDHLKVFGCLSYASTLSHGRTKFAPRSTPCVFIGFQPGVKGYKLLEIKSQKVILSRNVLFHELILPYRKSDSIVNTDDSFCIPPQPQVTLESLAPVNDLNETPLTNNSEEDDINNHPSVDSEPVTETCNSPTTSTTSLIPRRSTRISKPPSYLKDYHCTFLATGKIPKDHAIYPLHQVLSYDNLSTSYRNYSLSITIEPEPQTFNQAVLHTCWRKAMQEELQALEDNGTWTVTELPSGKRSIGCKWVYKIKRNPDGSIERYKARLVAKGFTQVYGVDFTDTFSPVAKINSVKALLAVAAVKNWHLHQMDVSNAFLHGDLDEEVYMDLPQGLEVQRKGKMVCKLVKSLYGLKQASRMWFIKLTTALKNEGFKQSASDHSVFIYTVNDSILILLVYVDDIILASNDLKLVEDVKQRLKSHFKVKDLGQLRYFLGLEIARNETGISMCQRKYCLEMIEDTGLLHKKASKTPSDYKLKLRVDEGEPLEDGSVYRQLVGRLHYITITRPDISYAVQQLSQFQSKPTSVHLQAAYKVIRYLRNAPGQGLLFSKANDLQMVGYCDSDWASCPDTRRSTSGFCLFIGKSLVSWKTKKQSTVSRSSSEAEYRALAQICCEVQWMKSLLEDFGVTQEKPIQLYCDNQSAIHIARNPVFHERTKHIEIDCHVVRERLQSGMIQLSYVPTEVQLADAFTKGLPAPRLRFMLNKLGITDIYSPACGGVLENKTEVTNGSMKKEE
ncbi:Retrovirus-related Pol polyprotein from transposon TNT 1-94 [Linum perenne]